MLTAAGPILLGGWRSRGAEPVPGEVARRFTGLWAAGLDG